MNHVDALRELDKIGLALERAERYFSLQNQANAELHMSDKVLYSPLTMTVTHALTSVEMLRAMLEPEPSEQ